MADHWTQDFCLGCDQQTDGTAYCSESCRLADFDKTSMPGSVASSPGLSTPSYPWATHQPRQPLGLFLTPAIDFSNPQPFAPRAASGNTRTLVNSSSNSSLSSMNTSRSSSGVNHLSEKTKQELQGYAASFDTARLARRRSY